jgi:hypothetical protein
MEESKSRAKSFKDPGAPNPAWRDSNGSFCRKESGSMALFFRMAPRVARAPYCKAIMVSDKAASSPVLSLAWTLGINRGAV